MLKCKSGVGVQSPLTSIISQCFFIPNSLILGDLVLGFLVNRKIFLKSSI